MNPGLTALRSSVERLRSTTTALDDAQLVGASYCSEWTIADVLSHLGSGAVIMQRRLQDVQAGTETPDGFAPAVWEEWNAKSPRAKTDDALAADRALVEALEAVSDEDGAALTFSMGPLTIDFPTYVGLRLNEHVVAHLGRGGGLARRGDAGRGRRAAGRGQSRHDRPLHGPAHRRAPDDRPPHDRSIP